jgi:hypothetical protein
MDASLDYADEAGICSWFNNFLAVIVRGSIIFWQLSLKKKSDSALLTFV